MDRHRGVRAVTASGGRGRHLGSDFDGTDIPAFIRDAEGLAHILREMKRRGYSDSRLERICNGNFLRVAEQAWR